MITSGWWCVCPVAGGSGPVVDFLVCGTGVWWWDVGLVGGDLEGTCDDVGGGDRLGVWW